MGQPIRLPGQIHDRETGLYYNRHRYYDPQVGGYNTQDPIGLEGGANMFAYVEGNPLSFTDPMGLQRGAPARTNNTSRTCALCGNNSYQQQATAIGRRHEANSLREAQQKAWLRDFTRKNQRWGDYSDGLGALAGGGIKGRHPSVPNAIETLIDPHRTEPFVPGVMKVVC
ncbi:RHS repeat-associated core domain-containing protein [Comamonas sp. JUb58]|uniref:RHS repeat-associated core domain-containing protein n=1 Tax=Comamonas sp. JUb58 TaxID=2485114 RepID=UPI00105D800A|nr:RHS repeat-associated core domain-containing protein [Comamonas sp. JUb58]